MEQRKHERRAEEARVFLSDGTRSLPGLIRNISFDGALIGIEAPGGFATGDVGVKLAVSGSGAAAGENIPELRSEGKLVRIFEVDGKQYVAIRFLDYMGRYEEG